MIDRCKVKVCGRVDALVFLTAELCQPLHIIHGNIVAQRAPYISKQGRLAVLLRVVDDVSVSEQALQMVVQNVQYITVIDSKIIRSMH